MVKLPRRIPPYLLCSLDVKTEDGSNLVETIPDPTALKPFEQIEARLTLDAILKATSAGLTAVDKQSISIFLGGGTIAPGELRRVAAKVARRM